MTHPCFFGYGSLVNRATHSYPNARRATAVGWKRAWVHTSERNFAYLSAIRSPDSQIDGLIAEVPGADWAALDAREHAYDRILDSANIQHDHDHNPDIAIYSVPVSARADINIRHPVLLSYLDVVLQGYMREYGAAGAAHFLTTTEGWDAPILNDRNNPIYPRHQRLSAQETELIDDGLNDLGVRLIKQT